MTRIRTFAVLFIAAGAALLPACGGGSDSATTPAETPAAGNPTGGITIKDFSFTVGAATAGQPITVTNDDGPTHTVTFDDGSEDIELAGGGQSITITVEKAGTYAFHCNIHPSMKATLTVA